MSKTLLDAPQLLAIVNLDTALRRVVNSYALPSFLRGGIFLLPVANIEIVEEKLGEFQEERARLVEAFLEDYPDLVRGAQARLRTLFQPADYPEPDLVRSEFLLAWRYVTFQVPTTLEAISRDIFAREREKAAQQWQEAAIAIQSLLRANLLQLVAHMNERLAPDAQGKAKIFKGGTVSNLSDFLKGFDARNITDDHELASVVERARQLLDGVDPQVLRQSEDVRDTVREGFAQVQQHLNSMVAARPVRRIVVDRPLGDAVGNAVGNSAAQAAPLRNSGQPLEQLEQIAA